MINFFKTNSIYDMVANASVYDTTFVGKPAGQIVREGIQVGCQYFVQVTVMAVFCSIAKAFADKKEIEKKEIKIEAVKKVLIQPVVTAIAISAMSSGVKMAQNYLKETSSIDNNLVGYCTSPILRVLSVHATYLGMKYFFIFKNEENTDTLLTKYLTMTSLYMYPLNIIYEKEKTVLAPIVTSLAVNFLGVAAMWLTGAKVYFFGKEIK